MRTSFRSLFASFPQPFANLPFAFCQLALCALALCTTGCEEYTPVPKPRAYPRVIYPEKVYKPFDATYCNFTFDMPAYATIEKDTSFFDEKPKRGRRAG